MTTKSSARFIFENARIMRVKELPKVCFLDLYVQAGKYADYQKVVLFQPASFPLVEGDAVTVTGEIQKRKPKEPQGHWDVEFIGREVKKGDASKAPTPRASRDALPNAPASPPVDENDDVQF